MVDKTKSNNEINLATNLYWFQCHYTMVFDIYIGLCRTSCPAGTIPMRDERLGRISVCFTPLIYFDQPYDFNNIIECPRRFRK